VRGEEKGNSTAMFPMMQTQSRLYRTNETSERIDAVKRQKEKI